VRDIRDRSREKQTIRDLAGETHLDYHETEQAFFTIINRHQSSRFPSVLNNLSGAVQSVQKAITWCTVFVLHSGQWATRCLRLSFLSMSEARVTSSE